jgi:hypothetical protein
MKEAGWQWLTHATQATREAKIERTIVRGQSRQKVHKTPSQPIAEHEGTVCHPSYFGKYKVEISWSSLAWAKSETT